ncbi:MAG: hypothetical protein PHP42_09735 [Bacteroidota bacterium]|nr:hypothetical protein [Bacteroidota bacterium]
MLQQKLLSKTLSVLHQNNIDYMITGSVASSLHGEPRTSHDIDMVVSITETSIPTLIRSFPPPQYYLTEESIREAIVHKSMFNLIQTDTGDKIDFWILTNEAFDQSRFKRKYVQRALGVRMYVSTPEDTILMKLKWSKDSGGSTKQNTDALRIYELQHHKLDTEYIENWSKLLDVKPMWDELKKIAKPIV